MVVGCIYIFNIKVNIVKRNSLNLCTDQLKKHS